LYSQGAKGVSAIMLMNYSKIPCFGLLLERKGKYKGKFNVCSGKMDKEDNGCFLNTLCREFREEAKFDQSQFRKLFCNSKGVRVFVNSGTAIFIAVLPKTFSREQFKLQVQKDDLDDSKSIHYKEIEELELFRLDNFRQIETKKLNMSNYAYSTMILFKKVNKINHFVYF